jgi:hypothetical protein
MNLSLWPYSLTFSDFFEMLIYYCGYTRLEGLVRWTLISQGETMATMIPKEIDEFKSEGEKRFYRLLESVARPDQGRFAFGQRLADPKPHSQSLGGSSERYV